MPLRKKGMDPASARTNQKRVIIIKPSLVFNSCLWPLEKYQKLKPRKDLSRNLEWKIGGPTGQWYVCWETWKRCTVTCDERYWNIRCEENLQQKTYLDRKDKAVVFGWHSPLLLQCCCDGLEWREHSLECVQPPRYCSTNTRLSVFNRQGTVALTLTWVCSTAKVL